MNKVDGLGHGARATRDGDGHDDLARGRPLARAGGQDDRTRGRSHARGGGEADVPRARDKSRPRGAMVRSKSQAPRRAEDQVRK